MTFLCGDCAALVTVYSSECLPIVGNFIEVALAGIPYSKEYQVVAIEIETHFFNQTREREQFHDSCFWDFAGDSTSVPPETAK